MTMRVPLMMFCGLLFFASGCKKEPGEGGKAELQGVVMRQEVTAAGAPTGDPYPYKEARVYIIYGDGDYSDDDVRTGPDGGYAFRWLRKGKYTIYVFGEQCKSCADDMVAVTQTITIDGNKDVVTVPVLTALNF